MKRILILSAIALTACGTQSKIKRSDLLISTPDASKVWILNNEPGQVIAKVWNEGRYGDAKVYLVDSAEFEKMIKRN